MRKIAPVEVHSVLRELIEGARVSLMTRANSHLSLFPGLQVPTFHQLLGDCQERKLPLRAVIGVLEIDGDYDASSLRKVLSTSEYRNAFENRTLHLSMEWHGFHCLLVDDSLGLIGRHGFFDIPEEIFLLENRAELAEYTDLVKQHWQLGSQELNFLIRPPDFESKNREAIIVASREQWAEIIESLRAQPERMRQLPPRKFEELIAEMLAREGMEVELTPQTRDGGRDILAWVSTPFGKFLYLVECKRYSRERPVGVGLVRQFYGTVEAERACGGIFVTTSAFTSAAWGFQDMCKSRLKLADYTHLANWLQSTQNAQPIIPPDPSHKAAQGR